MKGPRAGAGDQDSGALRSAIASPTQSSFAAPRRQAAVVAATRERRSTSQAHASHAAGTTTIT